MKTEIVMDGVFNEFGGLDHLYELARLPNTEVKCRQAPLDNATVESIINEFKKGDLKEISCEAINVVDKFRMTVNIAKRPDGEFKVSVKALPSEPMKIAEFPFKFKTDAKVSIVENRAVLDNWTPETRVKIGGSEEGRLNLDALLEMEKKMGLRIPESYRESRFGKCDLRTNTPPYTDFLNINEYLKQHFKVIEGREEDSNDVLVAVVGNNHRLFSDESQKVAESVFEREPSSESGIAPQSTMPFLMEFYITGVDSFALTENAIRVKAQRAIRNALDDPTIKCNLVSRHKQTEEWTTIPSSRQGNSGEKIKVLCDNAQRMLGTGGGMRDWSLFSSVADSNFRRRAKEVGGRDLFIEFKEDWTQGGRDFLADVERLHERTNQYCTPHRIHRGF